MKRVLICIVVAAVLLLLRLALVGEGEPGRRDLVVHEQPPEAGAPSFAPPVALTPPVAPVASRQALPPGPATRRSIIRGEVEGVGSFVFRAAQKGGPRFEVRVEAPGPFELEAPPGDYTFETVPLGDPWLTVSPATGGATAQVDDGDPSWRSVSLSLGRNGRLVGQVFGHSGPLAGAWVRFDPGTERESIVVRTDRDGRYELVTVGVGRLHVSSGEDHHDHRGVVTIWPGRERRRDVRLVATAELVVTVRAPSGALLLHASVETRVVGQEHLVHDVTGDDGCAVLEDLVPGDARVIVRSEDETLAGSAIVRLEPGANAIDVMAVEARLSDIPPRDEDWPPEPEAERQPAPGPALARIAGEVREESGALIVGAVVIIEWLVGQTLETVTSTGASGRFELDELPDGVYLLTIWRPHERSMAQRGAGHEAHPVDPVVGPLEVEVQGQRDTELRLVAPDW